MDSTYKRNDENLIELTIGVKADEVQKHIKDAYKKAGKVRIPGFRPGKAPRNILENYYGGKEYFAAEATDSLVKDTMYLAIDNQNHVPLDSPEPKELNMVEEGKDYTYCMTYHVCPEFELTSYEPVQIELDSAEPTKEEVDAQIDIMLGYYADIQTVDGKETKVKPELTDEFAKEKLEFESAEDFRNQITESLKFQKQMTLDRVKETAVAEALIERLQGEPTELLVAQASQDMYRDFFNSLQRRGTTMDAYLANNNLTADEFREDMKTQADKFAKHNLALDAFAKHLKLEVSEDDLLNEFIEAGAEDPKAMLNTWVESARVSELREGVLRMKAAKQIAADAVVFKPGKKPADKKKAKSQTDTKAGADNKVASEKAPAKKATAAKTASTKSVATKATSAAKDSTEAKTSASKTTEKKPAQKKSATKSKE